MTSEHAPLSPLFDVSMGASIFFCLHDAYSGVVSGGRTRKIAMDWKIWTGKSPCPYFPEF